jgi:hypothetical protein
MRWHCVFEISPSLLTVSTYLYRRSSNQFRLRSVLAVNLTPSWVKDSVSEIFDLRHMR